MSKIMPPGWIHQKFYADQLQRVSANNVIHCHAVIHKALKYTVTKEKTRMSTGFHAGLAMAEAAPDPQTLADRFHADTSISQSDSLLPPASARRPTRH